jgi:predicted component of type VI protein secretion system
MKSMSVTTPSAVSKRVSRMSEWPRYRRVARAAVSAGAMIQRPCSDVPSSAAKHASESKRGQQSQSSDPLRATSAAVSQSPISA